MINKPELAKLIARRTDMTQVKAMEMLEAALDIIKKNLAKHEKISLAGLGTFSVKTRKSKSVRNPKTKELMTIPDRHIVQFAAATDLRQALGNLQ